ncbi:uncharacterized protein LOC131300855 [Rhododendron vialii]|uniref:uncharacterized protein LOC131300855 n=1 Tax=Rhododendron vialii TaxID=182163 RepID=UPI00265EEE0C|nr:uncharacterized protein LOC131300855 [Rhododendron vialii]
MERKVIVICSILGLLGLLSAATDFAAEAMRTKGSQIQPTSPTCTYSSSTALVLGFISNMALSVAQIIINVTTGCFCCKRDPHLSDSDPTLAHICCVVSGFTFVIALLLYYGSYYCYLVWPGVFAGAAMLSLATVMLNIVYYLVLYLAKNKTDASRVGPAAAAPNHAGIALGQAQFPPPNTQAPVFVHEDTYIRRQFP